MMELSNPVDRQIELDFGLILDNNESAYARIREACAESILGDDLSTGNSEEAYRASYQGQDDNWYGFCECAGLRVVDVVRDIIEEEASGFTLDLIEHMLDLGNRQVWKTITERYMPEPDAVFPSED